VWIVGGFAGLRKTALLVCGRRGVLSPRGRGRVVFDLAMPSVLCS